MAESAQLANRGQNTLFAEPMVRIATGNSLVLLATALAETPGPTLFEGIAAGRPQNYAVVQNMVILDFNTIQCLVLPGDPLRLQVQWTEGRSAREAGEFARRFFSVALGPRMLGVNFGYRFDFATPAIRQVRPYLDDAAVRRLIDSEPTQAGIKLKFEREGWRTLLALDPGAAANQTLCQINFERDAVSPEDINGALDTMDDLERKRDELLGRLHWTD